MIYILAVQLLIFLIISNLDDYSAWMLWDVNIMATLTTLSIMFYRYVSFKDYKLKTFLSVLIIVFGLWLFEIIMLYSDFDTVRAFTQIIWVSVLVVFFGKMKYIPSEFKQDKLDNKHLFFVRTYAHSWLGVIGSLIYYPFGKGAIYADGYFYKFDKEKRVLVKIKRYDLTRCDVRNVGKLTEKNKYNLTNKIGSKWTPLNNCLSILKKI